MTNKRRRPPPRVLNYLAPCPDCNARFEGTSLHHEVTCPLGNGVEAVCDADREYFATHPDEWYYTRPISAAERQTMEHLDPVGAATNPDHVHVLRQPFGRIRQFCNHHAFASIVLDPDDEAAS